MNETRMLGDVAVARSEAREVREVSVLFQTRVSRRAAARTLERLGLGVLAEQDTGHGHDFRLHLAGMDPARAVFHLMREDSVRLVRTSPVVHEAVHAMIRAEASEKTAAAATP